MPFNNTTLATLPWATRLVGAAALTAGAIAEDGTLDVAIDLIASAVDVVETVADVVDVAEAASGLFDLFGD